MSRKKIRYLILGVIVFYIVTAAFTFFMLKSDDSVLAEQTLSEILFGKENEESSKSANQPVTESFSEMFTVCHPVSTEKRTLPRPTYQAVKIIHEFLFIHFS